MRGEQLVMVLYCDLSGITRGRAVPRPDLPEYLRKGVSWVPANLALSAFGPIAPNPWGAIGDLRLMADPDTEVRIDLWPENSPLHFYQSAVIYPDGRPFTACPRSFLKRALADLEAEAGVILKVAFEQEFHLSNIPGGGGGAFALDRYRLTDPFGPLIMAALREAQQEPEVFTTEYGDQQFEVTTRPAIGLQAADRAVAVREIVREVARRLGNHASFSPAIDPQGSGNGVHIHFSLSDTQGRPLTYDPVRPGRVSALAGSFVAGVIAHLPALVALTCPCDISYLRLVPQHWSAAYTAFGANNREVAIRICPTIDLKDFDPAPQLHLEYRAADAAASPHLALGALVRAGLEGIRATLEAPPLIDRDPADLDEAARERLGIRRLPTSLELALCALEADGVVRRWLHPELLSCYLQLKRFEMAMLAGLSDGVKCRRYQRVY